MSTFKKDGCSGGMSKIWLTLTGELPPWEGCCDAHDLAYAQGGTRAERRKADNALYECVKDNGHPVWAVVMWLAVRLFGHPAWPTRYRWGFEQAYSVSYPS